MPKNKIIGASIGWLNIPALNIAITLHAIRAKILIENCFKIFIHTLTPGSPSKFLMAAFVRVFAQKVTAEICPVQPFVMHWTAK